MRNQVMVTIKTQASLDQCEQHPENMLDISVSIFEMRDSDNGFENVTVHYHSSRQFNSRNVNKFINYIPKIK